MDANAGTAEPRETVLITIGGQETRMLKPTSDQAFGLSVWAKAKMDEGKQLDLLTNMFLSLLDDEGKAIFVEHLLMGGYTAQDMGTTLMAAATAKGTRVGAPPKKTAAAKKVAAKKTASARRPRAGS